MTIRELREKLSSFNDDLLVEIWISNKNEDVDIQSLKIIDITDNDGESDVFIVTEDYQ